MSKLFRLLACLAAGCAVLCAAASNMQAEELVVRTSKFSGKQVPRFESLRYSAVHGRQGPSLDHPIVWRYERLGLPVLIVRETHGWRRIRDPHGDEVWVQARMLSQQRRSLIVRDAVLRADADGGSKPIAELKAGALLDLIGCTETACQISVDRTSGWVDPLDIWGAEPETSGL
ncbi:MAG: SH3 domain-containing protein [Pseudomonadota bacterium]